MEVVARGRGRTASAVLIALVISLTALYALFPDGALAVPAYLGAYASAAALAWSGVVRHPRAERGPWRLVAVAVTLAMTGDVVHQGLLDAPTTASIADPIWLTGYVLLAIALVRLEPPTEPSAERDPDAVIDGLVALVVGAIIAWELGLDELVRATGVSVFDRVVAGLYPVIDVILLAVVVRLLLRATHTRPLLLAASGTVVLLGTDLAATAFDESSSDLLGLGWMAAILLLTSSTLPGRHGTRPTAIVERLRVWMVLVPVGVPIGLLLRGQITHDHPNPVLAATSAAVLLTLAAVRSGRLLRKVEAAKRAVQEREHRFRALAANASDLVVVVDVEGRVMQGADALADVLHVDPELFETTPTVENDLVLDPASIQTLLLRAAAAPGVVFEQEASARRPDGSERRFALRLSSLLHDPVVNGIVANVRDVTDQARTEDELRRLAMHDPLTGLANRALLRDRIEQALRREGGDTVPALLQLDLDGFKSVNERLGRAGGDRLLQGVAERLRQITRTADTVARVGADELAVFIEDNHTGAGEAVTTADRILQSLDVPVAVDGEAVVVSASIGVAVVEDGTSAADLMRHADIALHQAKAAGPGHVVVYDQAMGTEAGETVLLREELACAADRGELVLHLQPQIDLVDESLVAFEALVRWQHPRLGLVPPARFIPLAEETGLIVPIGRWILHEACATAAAWRHPDGTPLSTTIGVNLSGQQIDSDDIVDEVRSALATSGLDPHRLVVEMTETALVRDPAAAAGRLRALSELGVRIAIDDFGTGYSSLAYLRQFPIDILKIDMSFVETITDADELPPIVRGLLDLGHTLDLEVVAEGIERPVQRDGLRRAGCETGQGYLFGRPMPAAEAERCALEANRRQPSAQPSSR